MIFFRIQVKLHLVEECQ